MKKALVLLFAAALFSVTAPAAQLTFGISSVTGTSIVFAPGGSFSFSTNGAGVGWDVDNDFGMWPSSLIDPPGPYTGAFLGSWTFTAGPNPTVSGTGTFQMNSPTGQTIEGDLTWVDIDDFGLNGFLNPFAVANIANLGYTVGSGDINLDKIMSTFGQTILVSFQFDRLPGGPQGELIDRLYSIGGSTTYSGTFSTNEVPEPGTYAMLGAGLVGLAMLRRRTVK
jgi:hypothetical protein